MMNRAKKLLTVLLVAAVLFAQAAVVAAQAQKNGQSVTGSSVNDGFVRIKGVRISGNETWVPESNVFIENRALTIPGFYICDHEVTRGEWKAVVGSYPGVRSSKIDYPEYELYHDLGETTDFYDKNGKKLAVSKADNNPAGNLSWVEALYYCNYRSMQEGLTPCYTLHVNSNNNGFEHLTNPADWVKKIRSWDWAERKQYFTCDFNANGYRLPTAAEWEWAARGKEQYEYPGSDDRNEVAWLEFNTKGTRDVKSKKPNAFGLYDMSGNVSEHLWDAASSLSMLGRAEINSDTPYTGPGGDSSEGYDTHPAVGLSFCVDPDYFGDIGYDSERKINLDGYFRCGLRVVRTDTECTEYEAADPDALSLTWGTDHGQFPFGHPAISYNKKKIVRTGYVLTEEDLPDLSEKGWTFLGWSRKAGDVITEDTEVKALWKEGLPEYKVTYSYARSSGYPSVTLPSSKQLELDSPLSAEDLPRYNVPGYTFYWNRGVGDKITGPTTLELYCVKKGERIGTKAGPTDVGDIVFADGSAIPFYEADTLTKKQNALAVAVIFSLEDGHLWGMSVETSGEELDSISSYLPESASRSDDTAFVNRRVYDVFREHDTYIDVSNIRAWSYAWTFRAGRETFNSGWMIPSYDQMDGMYYDSDLLSEVFEKITGRVSPVDFDAPYLTSYYDDYSGSYGKFIGTRNSRTERSSGSSFLVLPVKDFSQAETGRPSDIRILYSKDMRYSLGDEANFEDKIVPYGYTLTEKDLPKLDLVNMYHNRFTGWKYRPQTDDDYVYIKPGTRLYGDIYLVAEYEESAFDYYGVKAPSEPKKVGDLVFSDGSATPAITLLVPGDERDPVYKDAQGRKYGINPDLFMIYYYNEDKREHMAGIVFYAGGGKLGDRTLMVGGKYGDHEFCSSVLYGKEITTIPVDDADGSDNFESLKKFIELSGLKDDTEDVNAFAHYGPFYYARNYGVKSEALNGSRYQDGWYVPTIEEWKELYRIRYITGSLSLWHTGVSFDSFDGMSFLTSVPSGLNDCYVTSRISARTPSPGNFDSEFASGIGIEKAWRLTPMSVAVIRQAD